MSSVYDAAFVLPAHPTHPFGKSPFRMRGVAYVEALDWYEQRVPGGMSAVLARAADPDLARFFAQRFEWSGWYDMVPGLYLAQWAGRVRGVPYLGILRENAEYHGDRAVRGFSGIVLRMLATETVAAWLPRVSSWFHDFGVVEARVTGPRTVRGHRTGLPRSFVQGWSALATSFTERVLRDVGAADARMHVLSPESDGTLEGYDLFRVPFELTWG
jgi:hypothetical protein